jgi:hypothetical protein
MAHIIKLHGTEDGIITIKKLENPYGEGSNTVASIGISLKGDENNPEWKAHIPLENIDDVIKALQDIKNQD